MLQLITSFCDAKDEGHVMLLGLLDINTTSDTVDHSILLTRLRTSIWNHWSPSRMAPFTLRLAPVPFGVSQGLVLGQLLYILYTAGLTRFITALRARVHQYAEEVQLYMYATFKCTQLFI